MSQEQLINPTTEPDITALQEAGILDAQGRAHDTHGHFVTTEHQREIIAHGNQILSGLNSEGIRHPGEVAREQAAAQRELARNEAMDRFNTAEKRGQVPEHAAGPDYRKATGLSHEDVQRLGLKSFSELATSARERKAQQEEAARLKKEASDARHARLEKLLEQQRERNNRNAIAENAAGEWRKEADKLRDSRTPHAAALREKLEGASYKERLEMGGEFGIQRAQQAAEGADKEHQSGTKRHVHVNEPSVATKRSQAETVAALRAHARGMRPGEELTRVDDKGTAYDEAIGINAIHVPTDEFTQVHEAAEREARGMRPGEELTRVDDKGTAYDEAIGINAIHVPTAVGSDPKGNSSHETGTTPNSAEFKKFEWLSFGSAKKPHRGDDATLIDAENNVFGVFDGVGSDFMAAEGAQLASEKVKGALRRYGKQLNRYGKQRSIYNEILRMGFALEDASEAIQTLSYGRTTAAVVQFHEFAGEKYAVIGNAGDSRVIRQRNDGTLVYESTEQGSGNVIHNWLGPANRYKNNEVFHIELNQGDKLLICTDGITGDKPE